MIDYPIHTEDTAPDGSKELLAQSKKKKWPDSQSSRRDGRGACPPLKLYGCRRRFLEFQFQQRGTHGDLAISQRGKQLPLLRARPYPDCSGHEGR